MSPENKKKFRNKIKNVDWTNVILNEVFPDELKIAKVLPIFKSDDSAQIGNYRPVSVLPFFKSI